MATKTINVQYKLRGDTLENLNTKNAVYGVNEPVVVIVPANEETGTPATILLKMGDGVTNFKDLPYVTAMAGDVPEWAKKETKPEYTAEEIKNLESYIAGKVEDTDTQYKLEQDVDDKHILKLFSKSLSGEEWTVVATITTEDTVYDDTAIVARIQANEDAIDILNGDETTEGSVKNTVAESITDLDLDNKYDPKGAADAKDAVIAAAQKAGDDAQAAVNVLVGDDTGKSVRTIAIEELANQLIPENAKESLDTLSEIAAWIQAHPDDATAMNKAIEDLKALVGTLPEDAESSTVVAYIKEYVDAAIDALNIGDYAKATDLATVVERITAIENTAATKVEASDINGNIKIDGTETTVYTLPDSVLHDTDIFIFDGGNA